MSPRAYRILAHGVAVGLTILTLLIAACAALDCSAAREYERGGFHRDAQGRWVP